MSVCREDGRFSSLRNLRSNSSQRCVLWDLDRGSEKSSPVFEHPFRQTTSVKVSMCEWSSYPAGREMALPEILPYSWECALSRMSTYISEFMFPITGTNGPRPNHPHTIMLPPPNLTVGTMQSLKKRSSGIRQTQTRPSDCQTVKRDSSLQRTVFHSPMTVSSTPLE
ncbi:hypothetical protein TNCV_3751321 [Trichonephila clavipes]|uniref:Uncharacterized protein n=1 Tax=Trichonephila clavipes TaxID=2585209 RepID=A0A8X6R7G4_TRICX|nr:hypothetical protein TNCV_3751321 [Trichonephila clavipes]